MIDYITWRKTDRKKQNTQSKSKDKGKNKSSEELEEKQKQKQKEINKKNKDEDKGIKCGPEIVVKVKHTKCFCNNKRESLHSNTNCLSCPYGCSNYCSHEVNDLNNLNGYVHESDTKKRILYGTLNGTLNRTLNEISNESLNESSNESSDESSNESSNKSIRVDKRVDGLVKSETNSYLSNEALLKNKNNDKDSPKKNKLLKSLDTTNLNTKGPNTIKLNTTNLNTKRPDTTEPKQKKTEDFVYLKKIMKYEEISKCKSYTEKINKLNTLLNGSFFLKKKKWKQTYSCINETNKTSPDGTSLISVMNPNGIPYAGTSSDENNSILAIHGQKKEQKIATKNLKQNPTVSSTPSMSFASFMSANPNVITKVENQENRKLNEKTNEQCLNLVKRMYWEKKSIFLKRDKLIDKYLWHESTERSTKRKEREESNTAGEIENWEEHNSKLQKNNNIPKWKNKQTDIFNLAWEKAKDIEKKNLPKKTIEFIIQHNTDLGETIYLCGNIFLLGSWNTEKSIKLDWNDGNVWKTKITFPVADIQIFFYKYIIKTNFTTYWEPGKNHYINLGTLTKNVVVDKWGKGGQSE